jgi:hypothetical protein
MDTPVLEVKIKKDDTLLKLEEHNRTINSDGKEIRMYVPQNFEKRIFHSARMSALIATACLGDKTTTLTEWWDKASNENIHERLSGTLVGITSAFLAQRIENSKHEKLEINLNEFVRSVAHNNRGLIDNSQFGHDFIFCSFDSTIDGRDYPRPIALSANNVQDFTREFLKIKREKIDLAFGISNAGQASLFLEYNTYEREKSLAALLFELYENTIQHGNRDENNSLIEGVRTFSVKRHIFNKPDEIKKQTEGFQELQYYFDRIAKSKNYKKLWFYEVTIIDNGIGIVKRFIASRPDFKKDSSFMALPTFEKLNHIITQSLSSKLFTGAGKGIKIALKNLIGLDGFATIRTNDIWAYFDGTARESKVSPSFTKVKTASKLENTRGTSYSIILPVSPK